MPNNFPASEDVEIEKALRGCAPGLPSALRSRTLSQCHARAEALRKRRRRLNRQLAGFVGCIVVMQATTLYFVDAQHSQLLAGKSPLLAGNSQSPLFASLSFSELSELWQQRSRQLAQLMNHAEVGRASVLSISLSYFTGQPHVF